MEKKDFIDWRKNHLFISDTKVKRDYEKKKYSLLKTKNICQVLATPNRKRLDTC